MRFSHQALSQEDRAFFSDSIDMMFGDINLQREVKTDRENLDVRLSQGKCSCSRVQEE